MASSMVDMKRKVRSGAAADDTVLQSLWGLWILGGSDGYVKHN